MTTTLRTGLLTATLAFLALSAPACDSGTNAPPPPGERAASELARDRTPNVAPGDADALVIGNTAFAVDAYHEIRQAPGNLFYSPLSVSMAMAMTYGGARGDTEAQMADALHFTLPNESLHAAFNWLDLELSSRGQGAQGADGDGFRLNLINNTFGQMGYQFLPEYLDLLALNYGVGMSLLDFLNDPEGARESINQWVAEVTEERIEDLLPAGSISPSTRLVLTNAVYFNAAWDTPFNENATSPGTFHAPAGDVTVDMMNGTVDAMTHMQGEGYQAIGLPYDGQELDMVLIIPDEGMFETVEGNLSSALFDDVFTALSPGPYGALAMPSFGFRTKVDMVEIFQNLGLIAAFDASADFSGINGARDLMITGIFHEAFIQVNEAGTEAAAATAVVVDETSVPQSFTVDRPFLFAIRDIQTGTVLFLGRVLDPSA